MAKAYIAGKITGNNTYKAEFKKAEEKLKGEGHAVMNPAVLNDGFSHNDYLHICKAMIDVCDIVYFLPSWIDSKGAYFEMGYAEGINKETRFL